MMIRVCMRWTVLLVGLAAVGNSGAPTTQPVSGALPTTRYVDAAFGFAIELPAVWTYERGRFVPQRWDHARGTFVNQTDAIGLLRARAPGGLVALQIQIIRVQPTAQPGAEPGQPAEVRLPTFDDWVVRFTNELGTAVDADRVQWDKLEIAGRTAALLTYDTLVNARPARTHMVCVPFDATTIWVLAHTGAAENDADALALREQVERLARTLTIDFDPQTMTQLRAAMEKGAALLERVRRQGPEVRLDPAPLYFEVRVKDQPIGYLRQEVRVEEHDFGAPGRPAKQPGLRLRERLWRFPEGGNIRCTRLDAFSGFDGVTELIESTEITLPPASLSGGKPFVQTDQVVRKERRLVSSYRTNVEEKLPDPSPPLDTGPVYFDLAWARLVCGLMLTAPAEPHGFCVYDLESRSVIAQIITPLGARRVSGFDSNTWGFASRVGMLKQATEVDVDRTGRLVRIVAGDLTIQRAAAAQIEQQYGPRREAARERFQLAPD